MYKFMAILFSPNKMCEILLNCIDLVLLILHAWGFTCIWASQKRRDNPEMVQARKLICYSDKGQQIMEK